MNDMDDFKMPYKIYGKLDKELMIDKYKRLRNFSYGLLVRFNHGTTQAT
jgi:hypothetical protein